MRDRRFEEIELDLYEDYDIRINRNYISLILNQIQSIEGAKNHEKAIPTKTIKTLPTADYLKKYNESLSSNPTILPPGCRYFESLPTGGAIVVIEEQPQFRTVALAINFDMMFQEIKSRDLLKQYGIPENWLTSGRTESSKFGNYYQLNLAMPYVIFVLYLDNNYQVTSGYPFFRVNQMIGLSDYLLKIPLSNINDSQRICFGSRIISQTFDSFSASAKNAVDVFWTSVFNTDYTYNIQSYREIAGISNYLEWQYLSRIDPMFIYRVDWIKMNNNINDYITGMRRGERKQENVGPVSYDHFMNTFTKPIKIAEVKTGRIRIKNEAIFYDVATGIYLTDLIRLEVGDSFKNESGNKEYHVVSFLGRRGLEPKIIRLSKNGKLFNYKINDLSMEYLKNRVESQRYIPTIQLRDDLVLAPDDIIKYKTLSGAEVFKRVYYIRKSIDGKPEIRMGNQYYLAANFPKNVEKYDIENPELYGMKLKKGDKYIRIKNRSDSPVIGYIEPCVFDGVDIGTSNNIIMKFVLTSMKNIGSIITIDYPTSKDTNHYRTIFPVLDSYPVCEFPKLVSVGRTLRSFMAYNEDGSDRNAKVYKTPDGYKISTDVESTRTKMIYYNNLIKDNKVFRIDTIFGFIQFEIGDLVVASNWKNPLSVLNIKRIEGFKVEKTDQGNFLYFVLMDKNGNLSQELFMFNEMIRSGYIRKIVTKYEDLESGTKIISNEPGISNFPKKDVNIIIGIIVDGPQPMVLCSNGCTLWYDDVIEKFTQIPMNSDEWKEKEHMPLDPRKIKFQAGDVVIPAYLESGKDYGYLMIQTRDSRSLKYLPLSTYTSYHESYPADKTFQDECIFDCIPNPRVAKAQQDKDGYIPGNFNFQGEIILDESSSLLFVTDQRSFFNVPDSDK